MKQKDPLLRLYGLAEQAGIPVECFPLPQTTSLSIMDEGGNCYIAIDPMELESTADETCKLAHELGHCMTGSFYNRSSPCDLIARHEVRADRWAIRRLLPRHKLERAYRRGIVECWQLAEYFGLPERFIRQAIEYYRTVV